MYPSNYQSLNNNETALLFKGIFFNLAPLNISLGLIVMIQNSVIFMSYYKDKAKFVPSLFMGIALTDIVRAQGDIVLSVISILVYSGTVESVDVLYKSIFYYMTTALPGLNCSKVLNIVLTVTLTIKVRDPFHIFNTTRIRKIAASICLVIVILHAVDTAIIAAMVPERVHEYWYTRLLESLSIPGIEAAWYISNVNGNIKRLASWLQCLYLLAPPVLVLICMVIQITHLRRTLGGHEGSSHIPNTTLHVSITVLMVSVLFFICHIMFTIYMLVYNVQKLYDKYNCPGLPDKDYINFGIYVGLAEFTLPLLYAALYPVILICRKKELRERYRRYITCRCVNQRDNQATPFQGDD